MLGKIARRALELGVYKTIRVIERVVRSKPLSEANAWIKRSVVMKTELVRFHNGVESIDKPKSRKPKRM